MNILNKIFGKAKISKPDHGVFNDFWNGQPNHLPLLKLRYSKENSEKCDLMNSFKLLDRIFKKNNENELVEGIKLLLNDENWRSHLVACIAILKISKPNQKKLKTDLWELLRTNFSMVSPQILVVLSLIDEDFKIRAKDISENSFIINYYNPRTKENKERNSEKIVSSVEFLLNGKYSEVIENKNGGIHSKEWKERLMELIENNKLKIAL